MTTPFNITDLKPLTTVQYDECREKALSRVKARIGEKPTRDTFKRELGSVTNALDWLALLVFLAALLISSVHIIQFMTTQAIASYHVPDSAPGVVIHPNLWAVIHQIGAILLAESATILFMTIHRINGDKREKPRFPFKQLSIPLGLAVLAALFVFLANISSGVNFLVSIMPPVFTLGIAIRLEAIIVETLRRQSEITRRYLEAMSVWESASADPTKHPEFHPLLLQEIWQALIKKNQSFADAPSSFKHVAVRREMERDLWTRSGINSENDILPRNGYGDSAHNGYGETNEVEKPYNSYGKSPFLATVSSPNGHSGTVED
jgi:hypothetical protein